MLSNVEFVSLKTSPAGKTKRVEVTYNHLSGKFKGQTWTKSALVPNLDPESLAVLKEAAEGAIIALEVAKDAKGFYNITQVRSELAAGAVAMSSSKSTSTTSSSSSYDNTGIKVGAARNQAISFLAATKGKSFTLDDVDAIAYEIVKRQAAQEECVRSGKSAVTETVSTTASRDTTSVEFDDDDIPL